MDANGKAWLRDESSDLSTLPISARVPVASLSEGLQHSKQQRKPNEE